MFQSRDVRQILVRIRRLLVPAAALVLAAVALPRPAWAQPSAPGPTAVSCASTSDVCWVTADFTASVSPATGGTGGYTYQICRSVDVPSGWAGCDVNLTLAGGTSILVSGSHLPADGSRRAYYFRAKDSAGTWGAWNSPRYVQIDRYPPTVSASNASDLWAPSLTATISASDPTGGSGLAAVRYSWNAALNGSCTTGTAAASGTSLTAPAGDNLLYVCARDFTGRVAQWSGRYRVSTPLTAPGPTAVACAYAVGDDCWVAGDFTASVTAATGGVGALTYQICRSVDSTGGWAGCNVNLTLAGGTSILVAGADLPADGSRRAYYFRAKDSVGTWGAWNVPRFVRVDRSAPAVGADNASDAWFASRTATVSASDAAGGAGANAGLQAVRYGWNTPPNAACTTGTATAAGATLTAPVGDNLLHLCARDNIGRVAQWSGRYRVSPPPTAPGPTAVACAYATAEDCWVTGDFALSATPATGGLGSLVYQICRSIDSAGGWAGCDVNLTLNGGTSITVTGSHLPADGSRRAYYFRARDTLDVSGPWNTPRYVRVDRYAPVVSATNASDVWSTSLTATLSASDATGGAGANSGLLAVRYRWNAALDAGCTTGTATSPGATLTAPAGDNLLYLCARDNTGRVGQWSGRYRVSTPPTVPGPTAVACAYATAEDCWVTGDFALSATPATGGVGSLVYQICRSVDSAGGWAGCDVNLALAGGTSILVSGSHLPADGSRRAYYFRARDTLDVSGPWNTPRYVRVDRYAPVVSATNVSDVWSTSLTATLSASDATGVAGANSGLVAVRYSWNAALDAGCTTGTTTSPGATLTAPAGDNLLYLCARDNTGRVGQWSGRYRVGVLPTAPGPTTVACAYATAEDCWVTGDFAISATPASGGTGSLVYQICRSADSPGGWAGCDANLTLDGGTSITVTGTHLPADGSRRAYYFRARDTLDVSGPWNTPQYVRVDRYAPAVSASNASDQWFNSRTATVSASDDAGGAAANSGLAEVRFRWNALDGACTAGTAVAPGTTLTVPNGDNVLYLCARDRAGRIAQWNGRYRAMPAPEVTAVAPAVVSQGTVTVLTVTGSHLQGAGVYLGTEPAEEGGYTVPPRAFPTAELLGVDAAGTALTVRIDATAAGLGGFYNLGIQTPGGDEAVQFRVVGAAPVVDVYTPSQPVQGSIHVFMLAGANLQDVEVVPIDSHVKVLEYQSSGSTLMGLLYVDSDAPPGATALTIRRPNGQSLTLAIDVVGSAGETALRTTQVEVPRRSRQPDVPDVLLQEPVGPGLGSLVLRSGETAVTANGLFCGLDCCVATRSQRERFSAVLLALTDLAGQPLTRAALNQLAPGQRLDFNSLTVAVGATLEYQFAFRLCDGLVTDVFFCIRGSISYMVPLVGGYTLSFDFCIGSGGTRTDLAAAGAITRHEWSTSNACVQVYDVNPASESGRRSHVVEVSCCTPADIRLHTTGVALNRSFDVDGEVGTVQPENCQEPPPQLRVFLDVDGDNVRRDAGGNLDLSHEYKPEDLDDSGRYLPCSPLGAGSAPPGDGVRPDQLPQRVSLIAAYVQGPADKLRIVPPPANVTAVEIRLQGTSMYPGIATNYPAVLGSGSAEPDLWLVEDGGTSGSASQSVTVRFGTTEAPSPLAVANLLCNDYGGTTSVDARPSGGGGFSAAFIVPPRAAASGRQRLPAIGWTTKGGVRVDLGSLQDTTDEDGTPQGAGGGDGLSAHSEFRGMVIGGEHYRLDPAHKDIFVEWNALFPTLGGSDNLGLQIHRPESGEMYTNVDQALWMNVHGTYLGIDSVPVMAVHLVEDLSPLPLTGKTRLGETSGTVALPVLVTATMYTRRIRQFSTLPQLPEGGLRDWILAHEIGHAVDICHREEKENGEPEGICDDGALIDPKAEYPDYVYYMHSGYVFDHVKDHRRNHPAVMYHANSLAQIKLK